MHLPNECLREQGLVYARSRYLAGVMGWGGVVVVVVVVVGVDVL